MIMEDEDEDEEPPPLLERASDVVVVVLLLLLLFNKKGSEKKCESNLSRSPSCLLMRQGLSMAGGQLSHEEEKEEEEVGVEYLDLMSDVEVSSF